MLQKIFSAIAVASIFCILILYFLHPVTNLVGDLGYYLKIGEVIVTTHTVPQINLFSYTYPTYPFTNMNWLSEVVFYLTQKTFGFDGLIILALFLSLASFSLIFVTAKTKFKLLPTLFFSLLSLQILYERTDIKPELFSYIFLSLFLFILFRYKERFTKLIFLLIPIELLWVNMHLYFFIGIVTLVFFLIDTLKEEHFKLASRKSKILLFVTCLSVLATFINPFFIKGALYPFFVLGNYGFKVAENVDFLTAIGVYSDPTFFFFGLSAVIVLSGVLVKMHKFSFVEICLTFFFTLLGFFAVRAFPLFVIGTFFPGVHIFSLIIKTLEKRYGKALNGYLLGIFFILLLILTPTIYSNIRLHDSGIGLGVVDNVKPAITFLKENSIQGPLYNNYNVGSYLAYQFYPQEKVFADARPEAYPKEFFQNIYVPIETSPVVFKKFSESYHFNVIIFQHTESSVESNQFLSAIVKNNDWKIVFINSEVIILVKNVDANRNVIAKFEINEKNVQSKTQVNTTKTQTGNLINLYHQLGWTDQWLLMNKRYLNFDPNNCAVLQNIAYILQQKKSPEFETYLNKYIQICRN